MVRADGVLYLAALLAASPVVQPLQSQTTGGGGMHRNEEAIMHITRTADRDIEVMGMFAVSRPVLFDAITQPDHLAHWMSAGGMALAEAHVDPRTGGTFRYVFQRPSGSRIEVRGAYTAFDPPWGFAYLETYDFSPLRIEVTTALEDSGDGTRFSQRLRYSSARERDEDFDGVATSSREAYAKLARYLAGRAPEP